MPPIGINGLPPQGLPTPQSVGSEAAGVASSILDTANQPPANVPANSEIGAAQSGVTPAEEAIPSRLMGGNQEIKVPVVASTPTAQPPQTEPAAPPDFGAFAPKPPENPNAQVPPAFASPTEQTDQLVTVPEPDWDTMAKSVKSGVLPNTTPESPASPAYDALDHAKLDSEVANDPEMRDFYEFVAQDPEAMIAILQGAIKEGDTQKRSDILRAIAPMIKGWMDKNILPH